MTDLSNLSSPKIHAKLLLLKSKCIEKKEEARECLKEAYNIIAAERLAAKGTLDDADLCERIPELVFETAVEFGWVDYPRVRLVQRRRTIPGSWIPNAPVIDWVSAPIPASELVEEIGRFKVEAGLRSRFLGLLAGRVAAWQAEALSPGTVGSEVDARPHRTYYEVVPVTAISQIVDQSRAAESTQMLHAEEARRPKKIRKGKNPVRRSQRYREIDEALQKIAESRPRRQEEVFKALEGRVVFPPAEPFMAARGWIAGFRRNPAAARAWLSKRWAALNLFSFPRGPKK